MDLVVDGFVNSDFCDQVGGDERCPDILDAVLRNGLPLLAADSKPDDFKQVSRAKNITNSESASRSYDLNFRSQLLETPSP